MHEIVERPKSSNRKTARRVASKAHAAKVTRPIIPTVNAARVAAVIAAAERSGLLKEKSGRIGGRVSPRLVRKAKASTGIRTDTDLIEFALASVALEDSFSEAFKAVRGTIDPDLDLGF